MEAEAEPRELNEMLAGVLARFAEAFMSAPSPGIVAAACKNEHYASDEESIDALAEALRVEYEAVHRRRAASSRWIVPISLWKATAPITAGLNASFSQFVERVVAAINRALRNVPRERVRLHVCWGNYEGPHDCDVPLRDDLARHPRRQMSVASCCRSRTQGTPTSSRCSGSSRSPTIRSSWRA